jgi:hypothetical protein
MMISRLDSQRCYTTNLYSDYAPRIGVHFLARAGDCFSSLRQDCSGAHPANPLGAGVFFSAVFDISVAQRYRAVM